MERYTWVRDDAIVSDGSGVVHGTAVLGLSGAAANGIGIVGVAYESDLWAIQAGDDVKKDHRYWAEAIDLVRDRPSGGRRKIIILEIQTKGQGNIEQSTMINDSIMRALAAGVVVCVPAGNAGKPAGFFDDKVTPIKPTGAIVVGATTFNPDHSINERAPDSNFGEPIVVYAPGDPRMDVTCSPDGSNRAYRNWFGGTSGATAKVAGVVALMLQVNKNLTPAEICHILKLTGTRLMKDPTKSGVFLNAEAAVRKALSLAL